MKSLITGASGFAGSHLAEYLLQQNQEVIALLSPENDLLNLQYIQSKIRVERVDIRDSKGLVQLVSEVKPQRIYHLAALSSPAESLRDARTTYEVNFFGTFNLLSAVREIENDCRILCVSSSEVYGAEATDPMPLHEGCPLRPGNPYAASKAAGEMLAIQFHVNYSLPIVRARPFNHTGPRQLEAFVCSSLARQIVEIKAGMRPPTISAGNLKTQRDFSDVRDITRGYHLLLEKGEPGEVYQLCSGRPVSIESILQVLSTFTSKPIEVLVDESKVRSNEASAIWGDHSKATQATGWLPQFDLKITLRDLFLYWEKILLRENFKSS